MTQRTAAEYCLSIITAVLDDDAERGWQTAEALTQEVMMRPDVLPRVILGMAALAHDYMLLFAMERQLDPTELLRVAAIRTYGAMQ